MKESLKTFTSDVIFGDLNPDVRWIYDCTREKLQEIAMDFLKNCIENNIESSSSDGIFLALSYDVLISARCDFAYRKIEESRK